MDIAGLYHGPLAEFVARRTELVRELRSTDPDAAVAAGKLRKPPVGVWAIDQLTVDDTEPLTALLAAGADVRDAQQNVAAGTENREDLLLASARLRDAIEAAARAALAVLEKAGNATSDETGRRIRATLQAAATAGATDRYALWTGTLDRDLETTGFGAAGEPDNDVAELAAILAPMRRRKASPPREPTAPRSRATSELAAQRDAERDVVTQEAAAERARALADSKRRHAERIAEEARVAGEEATAAERAADTAEESARAAKLPLGRRYQREVGGTPNT